MIINDHYQLYDDSVYLVDVIWRFPKSWGYPQLSSIGSWDFPWFFFFFLTIQLTWNSLMTLEAPIYNMFIHFLGSNK